MSTIKNSVSGEPVSLPSENDPILPLNGWINHNTAILITHGIGDQLPISTLDDFSRGLLREYHTEFTADMHISHEIIAKGSPGNAWFDNVLRIRKKDSPFFLDIYEYYWANYTENKASWTDLNEWLQGVIEGAQSFYKKNAQFGERYKDKSIFFNKTTGKFITWRYRAFLSGFAKIFMATDIFLTGVLKLVGYLPIPFLGKLLSSGLDKLFRSSIHQLTNVIGDIAVYNVIDPKSKFYCTRKQISDGASGALKFLIERASPTEESNGPLKSTDYYEKIVVAGHSLGSQIAYDSINNLNLLVNQGMIENYDSHGLSKRKPRQKISDQLCGFVTFGSPLDKIVFFIRENVGDAQYLKQQILEHYHGFKQNPMLNSEQNGENLSSTCRLTRLLDSVQWRNYYDDHDYVSGGLDYFSGLTNVNCGFKAKWYGFTHSNYWENRHFYRDIINHFCK
jgi:hypothetical protein